MVTELAISECVSRSPLTHKGDGWELAVVSRRTRGSSSSFTGSTVRHTKGNPTQEILTQDHTRFIPEAVNGEKRVCV